GAAAGFPSDLGLARYSSAGVARGGYSTHPWSNNYVAAQGNYVRAGCVGYSHCFSPTWNAGYPGAWATTGWAAGRAWQAATWPALAQWCSIPANPVTYDYGNTVVYQGDNVYVNGEDAGPADQYSQQATTLASQGQQAQPPANDQWQPLGVFALVQGDEKTSNNLFQLAIDQQGTMRGNYYDGLMDQTTPVYGSLHKKSQRAAWTMGEKKDRVFEAGIGNLTKDQAPVLVHLGTSGSEQMLLVRLQQPNQAQQ